MHKSHLSKRIGVNLKYQNLLSMQTLTELIFFPKAGPQILYVAPHNARGNRIKRHPFMRMPFLTKKQILTAARRLLLLPLTAKINAGRYAGFPLEEGRKIIL